MPNAFLSLLAGRWQTVLWCAAACVISLSFVVKQTSKLAEENRRLAFQLTSPDAVSETSQRVAILEKENEQLRTALATIPDLAATRDRLRTELNQQETREAEAWAGASNVI